MIDEETRAMLSGMTINDALKRRKLIVKQIESNSLSITQYSSQLSNEKEYCETAEKQKAKVKSLVQANEDLLRLRLDITQCLHYTNLTTMVTIGSGSFRGEYSMYQLITFKQKETTQLARMGYTAMNDNNANSHRRMSNPSSDVSIVRFYDPEFVSDRFSSLEEFISEIESRLDTLNATTKLIVP